MKRSPAAAFWLSLLPGLGHIYLGQTAMGVALALLAAGIIQVADRSEGFGIVIPIYWGFVMLDAHRAAQELNRSQEAVPKRLTGSHWWGVLLIVMGILFMLSNFDIDVFDYLWRFWPVALIALGVRLLMQSRARLTGSGTEIPPLPPPAVETPAAPGGALSPPAVGDSPEPKRDGGGAPSHAGNAAPSHSTRSAPTIDPGEVDEQS